MDPFGKKSQKTEFLPLCKCLAFNKFSHKFSIFKMNVFWGNKYVYKVKAYL